MMPDLFWIPGPWPGKLALVPRPRGGDWLEDEVCAWRRAGIDLAVSLLERDEALDLGLDHEAETLRSSGIQFYSFPIPDRSIPASTKEAVFFLDRLAASLAEGKNIAVHCRQSVGRSGMIAAGLLVKSGMNVDEAIDLVSAARHQTVPETAPQLEWIHRLVQERLTLTP
jgi:protein-tyrosine phosphatase